MSRIIVGLLMILFINGQTKADEEIPTSITDLIKSLVEWGMKIYNKIQEYKNPDKTKSNIESIMKQVQEVQNKLDHLETHFDIKLDSMLNMLLADIKLEGALNSLQQRIRHSLSKIDRYFDLSRQYTINGPYENDTLINFAYKALWESDSVPDLLDNLHEAFIPGGISSAGFLKIMADRTQLNILHDCDTFVSAQQKVYYIYIELIIAEIKGLMTQQACLMLKRWFDTKHNYEAELNITKINFRTRMIEYHELFQQAANQFSPQLRRCEVKGPKHGVDILEMSNFSRIAVLDSDFVEHKGCLACPAEKDLIQAGVESHTNIYNCKAMGDVAKSCAGSLETSHEYLWLKDQSGNQYGPQSKCEKEQTIYGGFVTVPAGEGNPDISMLCTVCVCSMDMNRTIKNDDTSIWRISVHSQLADIMNNYVVTGIRFITHNNALHIQIKETQFSLSGIVYNNTGWKDLYEDHFMGHIAPSNMSYESLRHDRKTIHLDDLKVPDGYVVTGVRWQPMGSYAFHLQLFVSPYDFSSGEVNPYGGFWIEPLSYPYYPEDYKDKKRTEIHMDNSDDPTRASEYSYSLASNKMIKFTHTDINKDAGQTTIPLLEATSVETQPAFPLSGIGITFKGRERYGGYLSLRIYTVNALEKIQLPSFEPEPVPPTTTTERVEYEFHSVDGETLDHSGGYTVHRV